jgi:hypothetical protein
MPSQAFMRAREAHLRSIGREDLIDPDEASHSTRSLLDDPTWMAKLEAQLDAEEA